VNKQGWPILEEGTKRGEGFLTDREIAQAIQKGQLISDGMVPASAKYACYEVHVGSDVQKLVMDRVPEAENDLYRALNIPEDGLFRINPGETFKIYAAEQLYMPADVFAITIPVGNMYKLGLNPETSFADPGFTGPFYVTACNYSPRIVKLKVGDALARVFFFKLATRPDRIHEGTPRNVPPDIERVRRPDLEELRRRGEEVVLEDVLKLVDPPHYEHAFVTQQLFSRHRTATNSQLSELRRDTARITTVNLCLLFVAILLALLYLGNFAHSRWPSFLESVLAEIVASICIWIMLVFLIRPMRTQFLDSIATLRNKGTQINGK